MFIQVNTCRTRAYTRALLDMVEQGVVDKDSLIQDLLGYLSEAEVQDFCRVNEYITGQEDEDEDE